VQRPRARVACAIAALLAIPGLLAADTAAASFAGFRTSNGLPIALLVAFPVLALVLAVVARRPRGGDWLAAHAPQFVTLAASTAVLLVLADWVAGRVLGPGLRFHHHPPSRRWELHPDPAILRGVEGVSRVTIDSLGIRGDEMPADRGVRRILCVGGSTTLCLYLDDDETWPSVLQRELNAGGTRRVWVGNLGQNSYSTLHHLRFTRYSELLHEVDDVCFLIGVNDFLRGLFKGSIAGAGGRTPIWWRSALHTALQRARERLSFRDVEEEDSTAARYMARRELRRKGAVVAALPDLGRVLDEYRTNVRDLIAQVRAAGARPVFMTQPVLWSKDITPEDEARLWFGLTPQQGAVGVAELARGMQAFNAALREVCAEQGAPCVDLNPLDGDETVFYDDCHFTESGARRVGETMAAWFTAAETAPRR